MKKILNLLFAFAIVGCTQAKNNKAPEIEVVNMDSTSLNEAYKGQVDSSYEAKPQQPQPNIENIPAFKILTTDNILFTEASLKKGKPVMIIYFSPDCTHCIKFMHELQPKFKDIKNVQIVMATWMKQEGLFPFYKDFDLKKYPNFVVGTEGSFPLAIQQYYQVKETPYIAVYDHKGKLVKAYVKPPKIDELMATIKKS